MIEAPSDPKKHHWLGIPALSNDPRSRLFGPGWPHADAFNHERGCAASDRDRLERERYEKPWTGQLTDEDSETTAVSMTAFSLGMPAASHHLPSAETGKTRRYR